MLGLGILMRSPIKDFTWLEDPAIHGLGCGDNSCKYIKPTGMATNGGCRCSRNRGEHVERFLLRNLAKVVEENKNLNEEIRALAEEAAGEDI